MLRQLGWILANTAAALTNRADLFTKHQPCVKVTSSAKIIGPLYLKVILTSWKILKKTSSSNNSSLQELLKNKRKTR